MTGPCMCGDICCASCGPLQGNSRCPVCRAWASEGCADPDACAKSLPIVLDAELKAEALALRMEENEYFYREANNGC